MVLLCLSRLANEGKELLVLSEAALLRLPLNLVGSLRGLLLSGSGEGRMHELWRLPHNRHFEQRRRAFVLRRMRREG